ncbi:L,D-transpeptidase family protein [Aestuariispira insulae]|uniref:L,D-peptidoglycan transpeptidase YkuD (ErfK/YbiS/YcfS/YnhG family) n=1 Tax=Aestuariispira insulae TaxID=1461337 RepID=A0A3D9HPL3_9PROT|nr:L,D-transpeptidase family protein [Aestuariispira insulae]RED51345.1 L,D-peptidoglycan transpeptidase YkuD (ErfK/YbiS/YcfS/YnhG family) [Aestuariispira insulae]
MDYQSLIYVDGNGLTMPDGHLVKCALGRGGIGPKSGEGDGITPVGTWPMRRFHYRADRIQKPITGLEGRAIAPDDGWCDASDHPDYNRLVKLPFPHSHEKMWREDRLYDLVIELGYNDDPVIPAGGSAIFMHVARPDFSPTEGCVALPIEDLNKLIGHCGPGTQLVIRC